MLKTEWEKIKYTHYDLHNIATSILTKYRNEITFRKDKDLHFDIYILRLEKHSCYVYIGENTVLFGSYVNADNRQLYYEGVSTSLTIEETNKAFERFEKNIKLLLGEQ